MSKTYEQQVQEQIEQYRNTEEMHDLPPIYHLWSGAFVGPGLRDVFGVSDINALYVEAFMAAESASGAVPHYLSLGCGDGAVEIGIAQSLLERGHRDFRFVCIDLSDVLLDRFRSALPPELAGKFELLQGDLNTLTLDTLFSGVMANHSLHHMVDLEGIFAFIRDHLTDTGVFVTSDMIGRNGHMRWPETRMLVDFFWPFLTQRQRANILLRRGEPRFLDHDCSSEGFEGVRAQDVLPLILETGLHPWKFFGFGGAVDVFVDRCFGPNLNPANQDDAFLLRRIGFLNELLLDAGLLKPTMMLAYFTKTPARGTVSYRNRTAEASVRHTKAEPAWLPDALADLAVDHCEEDFVFRSAAAALPQLAPPQRPAEADPSQMTAVLASLRDAQAEAAAARATVEQQARRIHELEDSSSWQLTAPLRVLVRTARRMRAK